MLNQVIIVGRLTETPQVVEGKATITLAVPRNYKNENGEYETDFITCELFGGVATNTSEYCKKGDIVGAKGRLENGNVFKCERITFLSSRSTDINQEIGETE